MAAGTIHIMVLQYGTYGVWYIVPYNTHHTENYIEYNTYILYGMGYCIVYGMELCGNVPYNTTPYIHHTVRMRAAAFWFGMYRTYNTPRHPNCVAFSSFSTHCYCDVIGHVKSRPKRGPAEVIPASPRKKSSSQWIATEPMALRPPGYNEQATRCRTSFEPMGSSIALPFYVTD